MTTHSMTHEQFEALLPAWMEGELRGDERATFAEHAERCAQCGPLVRDLEQIVTRAAALGPIEPPRELWTGIEARIGATVLPLAPRRRTIPLIGGLIAAAVLVGATAGITWKLAQRESNTEAPTVAAQPAQQSPETAVASAGTSSGNGGDQGGKGPVISAPPQFAPTTVARNATDGSPKGPQRPIERQLSPDVRPVSTAPRLQDEDKIYDREITRLRTVVRQRRSQLDPRTVMAIEKSLAVIDTAIAQARSALAADPASRFLNDQLAHTLDKKVELLRTAALLPARS